MEAGEWPEKDQPIRAGDMQLAFDLMPVVARVWQDGFDQGWHG